MPAQYLAASAVSCAVWLCPLGAIEHHAAWRGALLKRSSKAKAHFYINHLEYFDIGMVR